MENLVNVISVPVITSICFCIINLLKCILNSNEKFLRFIPLIGGVLGAGLGAVGYLCGGLGIIASGDILNAIFIGLSSGLAATGTHQIFKQLGKGDCNIEKDNKEEE